MKKKRQSALELSVYPSRWRLIATLLFCLLVLMMLAVLAITLWLSAYDPGTTILFALLFALCILYLLGFIWSALSLLLSGQPTLSTDNEGLTLRGLPFLGTVVLPWSEIKSVHSYRYLFLSYFCIVPEDARKLITRYGLLRFTLNVSSRFSLRTGAPLNISQGLLAQPVPEIARLLKREKSSATTFSGSSE